MRPSRRRLSASIVGLVLLGGALGAGYHVADERRLGRIAGGVLAVAPAAGAERAALDALREQVLALVRMEGSLRLRMRGVELRGRDGIYHLDVTGEKSEGGAVMVALTLTPAGQPAALRIDVRATAAAGGELDVRVDLAGEPARLGAVWPAGLLAVGPVTARSEVRLLAGGAAVATGRLTAGSTTALQFAARYDDAVSTLDVSRWVLTQEPGLDVTGTLRAAPAGAAIRVEAAARGAVDGARMDARARYEGGAFDGEVTAEPVSAEAVWRRLGLGAAPLPVTAGAVRARVAGTTTTGAVSADVDAVADRIEAISLAEPVGATLAAAVRLVRGADGLRPGPVEHAAITLLREGAPVATLEARSRAATAWPLVVEARVPDAAAVAPLLGPTATLVGSGLVTGEVDGAAGMPAFRGRLDADVAAAELTLHVPVVLTGVRASAVPVYWNAGGAEQPGAVSIERLGAHGLEVEELASSATLIDGLLRLPDLRYRHHEGHGSGWAEIALGGETPLRARVEGEDVDLAAVVRDTGSTLAQVTGRVRYTGSLQRLRGRGVDAVVQLRSQEGGEIGIEALEVLVASSAVEVESTGLLRQTLENLRVFEYESLDGVLRAADGQGTVDLSIKGRRRLGLFPGPVQAINFRNVPLDVLSRTLDRGTSR